MILNVDNETIKRKMDAEDMIERLVSRETKKDYKKLQKNTKKKLRLQALEFEKEQVRKDKEIADLKRMLENKK